MFVIFFYYYNLYRPAIAYGVDKFGIREIYPTKPGGEEWFMNMQDPAKDTRFNPQATITKNPDSWMYCSLNIVTSKRVICESIK
jgi:hypothetical protein